MPPQTATESVYEAVAPVDGNAKTDIKYYPGKGFRKVVVDPSKRGPGLNWLHINILIGIPLIAMYGLFTTPVQGKTLLLAVVFYAFAGFGITGGYHRMFSHKAWDAPRWVRAIVLIAGAAALQGSARWWCRNHRAHHKFTDTSRDPYNVRKGFFHAHFGWMMYKQDPTEVGRADISDLDADPLIRFQHKYYIPLAVIFSVILPTLIAGLWGDYRGGYFYAALWRIIFVHHATFFVNSLAHYLGDQSYSDLHTAFDSVVTALLTLGEGYHNYHHEFPQDYRNGIRWYHYDPTKWVITGLYKFGLAHNLRWINENEIDKARLQVQEARLLEKRNTALYGRALDRDLPIVKADEFARRIREDKRVLVLIDGKIFDVTEFVDVHPGGRETIMKHNGKDVTKLFKGETGDHYHSPHAFSMLPRYIVGAYQA